MVYALKIWWGTLFLMIASFFPFKTFVVSQENYLSLCLYTAIYCCILCTTLYCLQSLIQLFYFLLMLHRHHLKPDFFRLIFFILAKRKDGGQYNHFKTWGHSMEDALCDVLMA